METVGDRVRRRRDEMNLSQAELAERAGIPQQTIGAIESKPIRRPQRALEIARALNVDLNWLLTGEEYPSPETLTRESTTQPLDEEIRQTFPPTVSSGNTKEHLSVVVEIDARGVAVKGVTGESSMTHVAVARWLLPSDFIRFELRTNPDRTIMVEILGDAMSPDFNPGDRAFIDTSQRNPAHSGLFAIEMDGATIVRRLELMPDTNPKQVRIKPKNAEHSTFVRPLSELHIVGLVAGRFHRS